MASALTHALLSFFPQIVEQDRRLDTALMQSGKFSDALVSLMDWLGETEGMVASQKPPSTDYKVRQCRVSHAYLSHTHAQDVSQQPRSIYCSVRVLLSSLVKCSMSEKLGAGVDSSKAPFFHWMLCMYQHIPDSCWWRRHCTHTLFTHTHTHTHCCCCRW